PERRERSAVAHDRACAFALASREGEHPERRLLPRGLAGAQHDGWEVRVVHGVREALGLEANPAEALETRAVLARQAIEVIPGVELQSWRVGVELERAPAARIAQARRGRVPRSAIERIAEVVAARGRREERVDAFADPARRAEVEGLVLHARELAGGDELV